MSENIQSISQGTYTIGSTSATNFIAGPGISIDSPSAGTVRIGNDETLLFQTTGLGSSACNLSEPISSFDNIKIEYRYGQIHTYKAFTINKNFVDNINTDFPSGPQECFFQLNFNGASTISVNHGYQIQRANFGSSPTTATTVVNNESEYSRLLITRIWGINRISGNNA